MLGRWMCSEGIMVGLGWVRVRLCDRNYDLQRAMIIGDGGGHYCVYDARRYPILKGHI